MGPSAEAQSASYLLIESHDQSCGMPKCVCHLARGCASSSYMASLDLNFDVCQTESNLEVL